MANFVHLSQSLSSFPRRAQTLGPFASACTVFPLMPYVATSAVVTRLYTEASVNVCRFQCFY